MAPWQKHGIFTMQKQGLLSVAPMVETGNFHYGRTTGVALGSSVAETVNFHYGRNRGFPLYGRNRGGSWQKQGIFSIA